MSHNPIVIPNINPSVLQVLTIQAASKFCYLWFLRVCEGYLLRLGLGLQLDCQAVAHWGGIINRSGFKSQTISGFLRPNYTGHITCCFCKTSKWVCLGCFCVFLFPVNVFFYRASIFELKIDVLASRTCITSINLVCDYSFLIIKLMYTY